jgi:hypothetical protein
MNFAEYFCQERGVTREEFEKSLLRQGLYPHARLLLRAGLGSRIFAREREIIADLALANDLRCVASILSRLPWYYGRRWKIRHSLRLRLSSKRLFTIAKEAFSKAGKKSLHDNRMREEPISASSR